MNWARNRWVFGGVALAYAAGLLVLLPWASQPGYSAPSLMGVYGVSICIADVCTVVLLLRLYLREGTPHLLAFAASYAVSALLVIAHALSFPGAFGHSQVVGHETTSIITFLVWRITCAVLLLVGIVLGLRPIPAVAPARRVAQTLLVVAGTVVMTAASFAAALYGHMAPMQGDTFTSATVIVSWIAAGLSAAAVFVVFTSQAERPILAWVALVATASLTDMILSTAAGSRYTLGWYVARSSSVVSAYMLLAYLSVEFARELRARREPARQFVYFAAVALSICAVLLRYLMMPWLGDGFPYATLFGAVAIAVWMGGWGPGVLTAVLSFVLTNYFIQLPFMGFALDAARDWLALILYALSCALIISLGHQMRTARERSRRAEEQFRGSQEAAIQGYSMLRAVRDMTGDVADFTFEYINPRGAELANLPPQELIGRRLSDVLPGARHTRLFERLKAVQKTGEPTEFEEHYDADGGSRWFRTMVVKVGDRIAVSFFEVSQNKALERELANRAQQLERADYHKGRFLATLSHELRNPLVPLPTGLAVLRHRLGRDDSELLQMMDRQLSHLVRLVDDLLDVSRIDRGKIELRRERVGVEQFINSAVETARPLLEARIHAFVVHPLPQGLYVEGDPVRLAQIVSNILINAAKFTPSGGRIELGAMATGTNVEIRITDNGVGIDAAQLQSVFEIFVQLEANKAQSAGGLGLGLALVKSLVELHHGSVRAQSAGPGRGAEFIVSLPLVARAENRVLPASAGPRRGNGGNRILVVDDNEDAAQTLGALLRGSGHDVRVFIDSIQALEAARAHPPDVAFVDLSMPRLDGLEFARRVRRESWGSRVRLVAVTGMGRESDVRQALDAGFDAHLTKPADPDKLLALAAVDDEPDVAVSH
jgi:signal transduction histidine kinase/CheY-like chemotaxis protein